MTGLSKRIYGEMSYIHLSRQRCRAEMARCRHRRASNGSKPPPLKTSAPTYDMIQLDIEYVLGLHVTQASLLCFLTCAIVFCGSSLLTYPVLSLARVSCRCQASPPSGSSRMMRKISAAATTDSTAPRKICDTVVQRDADPCPWNMNSPGGGGGGGNWFEG